MKKTISIKAVCNEIMNECAIENRLVNEYLTEENHFKKELLYTEHSEHFYKRKALENLIETLTGYTVCGTEKDVYIYTTKKDGSLKEMEVYKK